MQEEHPYEVTDSLSSPGAVSVLSDKEVFKALTPLEMNYFTWEKQSLYSALRSSDGSTVVSLKSLNVTVLQKRSPKCRPRSARTGLPHRPHIQGEGSPSPPYPG